jgi:hypothetical protein
MKKHIIPIICYIVIVVLLFNIDKVSTFLSKYISSTPKPTIKEGNEYTKKYDFLFVQNSKDYVPYSYNDLLNIMYSVINQGWEEFTFYCPKEYDNCISDASALSKTNLDLTHANNFVHPYNSYNTITTSITESGEVTIKVNYLYSKKEIDTINSYVDTLIEKLYDSSKDDYENIKAIHDYIINNTRYDVERNDKGTSNYASYSAYGPVVDGYATCNGYADLMAIFLSKLNYENYKVATTAEEISYKSNGHIWNAVKIDGKYLHLDLTWDDPVSNDGKDYLYHKYFLVTTEEMKKADTGSVNVEEHNFNRSIYQEFMNN